MKIYHSYSTVESAHERILRLVNIWQSYRQENWLSQVLCASGHGPAERRTSHRSWVGQETGVVNSCHVDFHLA